MNAVKVSYVEEDYKAGLPRKHITNDFFLEEKLLEAVLYNEVEKLLNHSIKYKSFYCITQKYSGHFERKCSYMVSITYYAKLVTIMSTIFVLIKKYQSTNFSLHVELKIHIMNANKIKFHY